MKNKTALQGHEEMCREDYMCVDVSVFLSWVSCQFFFFVDVQSCWFEVLRGKICSWKRAVATSWR